MKQKMRNHIRACGQVTIIIFQGKWFCRFFYRDLRASRSQRGSGHR